MAMTRAAQRAVEALEIDRPAPAPGQISIAVAACGVCRTDLHVVDGDLTPVTLPIVPGHEIVGRVVECGAGVEGFAAGDRVGVPWLGGSCGACAFCRSGRENLCRRSRYTGYHIDGGYAEYTVADARFCFPLPPQYDDVHAAPLLCAGLIGYRAYRVAGAAQRLGIYGFGAAAHIIAQVARHDGREVYAFVSPGDHEAEAFARSVGVTWAGPSTTAPPSMLDAAIIFAPVGRLVPEALSRVEPGGTVVCAGIHMSDIPAFPYRLLWEERVVRSVANLTREDAREFLAIAARVPIATHVRAYPLRDANAALADLRSGRLSGAAVLVTAATSASPPRTSRESPLP
ncbi:MAG TPA: zinc-dependent alcohol dehydrogenase family protein [Vicinamibacterales bacterium]|nr:zinc-dependent alcohol dehydrogenase family protein [Vicinamibacterales bacterium]